MYFGGFHTQRMTKEKKKTFKIINKKYKVVNNKDGCLFVSENNGKTYDYSEFIFHNNETKIRVMNGGINIYRLSRKLRRRITGFLNNKCDVYLNGDYINIKESLIIRG